VKLPAAGRFDVAFQLDSPQLLHCFSAEVDRDPQLARARRPVAVEYLVDERTVQVGQALALRFRLVDPSSGKPQPGLRDARVRYYLAPGRNQAAVVAREVGDGVYEALLPIAEAGAYYVHAGSPSLKARGPELPYLTLRAVAPAGLRPLSETKLN
jgi:hypothetical protein